MRGYSASISEDLGKRRNGFEPRPGHSFSPTITASPSYKLAGKSRHIPARLQRAASWPHDLNCSQALDKARKEFRSHPLWQLASPFIDESRSEWVTGGGPGEMEQSDCPRFLPHPDYIDVLDRLDALDLIIKYPQLGFSQLQNCIMHLRILIANLDLRGQ